MSGFVHYTHLQKKLGLITFMIHIIAEHCWDTTTEKIFWIIKVCVFRAKQQISSKYTETNIKIESFEFRNFPHCVTGTYRSIGPSLEFLWFSGRDPDDDSTISSAKVGQSSLERTQVNSSHSDQIFNVVVHRYIEFLIWLYWLEHWFPKLSKTILPIFKWKFTKYILWKK